MPTTSPPTLTPTPTPAPQRGDRATFSNRFDAFITWFINAVTEFQSISANVYNNAVDAFNSATSASSFATNAANSAASAVATTGTSKWLAATSYTQGNTAWSPTNFLTYRRSLAGTGTTAIDPALDAATWTLVTPPISGQGGISATGNLTLTNASGGSIVVTPSGPGLGMTLGDARTYLTGVNKHIVFNAGDFDYHITNGAGTKLGFVRPGTFVIVSLTDNSTLAGLWNLSGVRKVGLTAVKAVIQDYPQMVQLDTDRFTFYGVNSGNLYAITYNSTTNSWGNETLIGTFVLSSTFVIIKSATDQLCAIYTSSTTNKDAVIVITATGTTLSPGTPVVSTYANSAAAMIIANNMPGVGIPAVMVGTTGVYMYRDSTTHAKVLQAFTISGTVPSLGTPRTFGAYATQFPGALFVSGSVVRAVTTDNNNFVNCYPHTVAGNGLTLGTSVTQANHGATTSFESYQNSNGNIIVFGTGSASPVISLFKLTGTVETTNALTGLSYVKYGIPVTGTTIACYEDTVGNTYLVTDTAGTLSNTTPTNLSALINNVAIDVSGNVVRYTNANTAATQGRVLVTTVNYGVSPPVVLLSETRVPPPSALSLSGPSQNTKIDKILPSLLSVGGTQYNFASNYNNPNAYSITATGVFNNEWPAITQSPTIRANNNAESWITNSSNSKLIQRIEAVA